MSEEKTKIPWPHAPVHQLATAGTYFLTASTYVARLNYVHQNPVKHGLVPVANQYPWCSARWFERMASAAQVRSIYRFKVDQVKVLDEFAPEASW